VEDRGLWRRMAQGDKVIEQEIVTVRYFFSSSVGRLLLTTVKPAG